MKLNRLRAKKTLKAMSLASIATMGLVAVSCQSVSAASADETLAAEKANLVRCWQRYFQSLRSLQLSFKDVMEQHPLPEARGMIRHFQVKMAGSRFRVEYESSREGKEGSVSSLISAYDGRLYQRLTLNDPGTASLMISEKPISAYLYIEPLPVMSLFEFAMREGDIWSVEFLQTPAPWRWVESNIEKIEAGTHKGIKGRFVTIKTSEKYFIYRVFVEEKSSFPLYQQATRRLRLGNKTLTRLSEIEVEKTFSWKGKDRSLLFPLKVHSQSTQEGKIFTSGYCEMTSPIKINQPISNKSIFTIPRSQATDVYDRDLAEQQQSRKKAAP